MGNRDINVLIVDDNEMNRETLARRLKNEGFNFSMAVNGREALEMAKSRRYDLILLDIMMPEIDGYTVLSRLKSNEAMSGIPVIMISAIEEMESVMKCMELGADDYLTKPFEPVLLKAAIARCIPKDTNSVPETPLPSRVGTFKTTLQLDSPPPSDRFELPEETTKGRPTDQLTVEEVVFRILNSGKISRKGYLYLSKALYNSIFSNRTFSEQQNSQISHVFDCIAKGRIQIVD
ncbi:response regulator [Tumidithrix elongata RA019]|uniref:histidine kinase n=1 Tax=Tumidithrix elongata BACA0141 TaxID=2716417 RepID=A0AAW9PR72_9CYAN|nr:response regulator [Tumidithrix elongata RA019]